MSAFILLASSANAGAAETSPQDKTLRVQADGSVIGTTEAMKLSTTEAKGRQVVRYDFALPKKPAERRWREDDALPICHTQWAQDGIRYTQIVLVTCLGDGDLATNGKLPTNAVLLVQLVGESLTNEYAQATAAFAVQVGGRTLNLELREGLVYVTGTPAPVLLGAIDIAAGGVARATGPSLRFGGHMPPGTSGAMTIKIPAAQLSGEAAINRLRDLEFDEEFRRVKRFWADRAKAADAPALPVAFSTPEKPL